MFTAYLVCLVKRTSDKTVTILSVPNKCFHIRSVFFVHVCKYWCITMSAVKSMLWVQLQNFCVHEMRVMKKCFYYNTFQSKKRLKAIQRSGQTLFFPEIRATFEKYCNFALHSEGYGIPKLIVQLAYSIIVSDLLRFFTFSDPNVRWVTIGMVFLGACCAVLGTFGFLRKRALLGDAIAHAVLPGICVAFLWTGNKNPLVLLLGACVSGWAALLSIDFLTSQTRLKADAALALVLSVFFGTGLLLLSVIQHSGNPNQAGLDKYLFGSAAAMTPSDINLLAVVGSSAVLVVLVLIKPLTLLAFDEHYARSIGMPVRYLEACLSGLTAMVVASGIQAVGVVLMAALLLTPPALARYWTDKLSIMLLIAAIAGAAAGVGGAFVSYSLPNMSTGPWVTIFLSIFLFLSVLFAPQKGIVPRLLREKQQRRKITEENVLKIFYKIGEAQNAFFTPQPIETLQQIYQQQYQDQVRNSLRTLQHKQYLQNDPNGWKLTPKGLDQARRIVRVHRLWEVFLQEKLKLPPDHVHDSAEAIEHIITPEIEQQLQQILDFPGTDPHSKKIPY